MLPRLQTRLRSSFGSRWNSHDDAKKLTVQIGLLEREIAALVDEPAPELLVVVGCAHLTAAKILAETAGVDRFRSRDAYARYNGTAPLPVWSSNKQRHRLSRVVNRQLNAALHRIAITQARLHPAAQTLLERRRANGDGKAESLRVLKRRLRDVIYQALRPHDERTASRPRSLLDIGARGRHWDLTVATQPMLVTRLG